MAPYLGPGCREKLVIGKFVQIARGSYFITSSANHPMAGVTAYPFRIFKPETFGYKDLPVRDTVVGQTSGSAMRRRSCRGCELDRARSSRPAPW